MSTAECKSTGKNAVVIRSIWRLRASGKLPEPVQIGGAIRWRQQDIERWEVMGCPNQKEFEASKGIVE